MNDLQCPTCGLALAQHEPSQHLDWWVTDCLGLFPDRAPHYSSNRLAAVTLLDALFALDLEGTILIRKGDVIIPDKCGPEGALRIVTGDFPLAITKAFLYLKTEHND